ncbi:STAM-binding protein-like A [Rhopilema esculentum]|uniref:STAM-binding protein-like A n=1 Tax=Rhopilema esculentum TaxID=499914 RepID=UPI0031CE54CE|eukprot:gene12865-3612_t
MAAYDDHSLDPEARFKLLSSLADNVQVDKNIPTKRYFRSGVELERMAGTYLGEGSIENAFTLYMKYIVLFVEKLPKHPQYKQADSLAVKKTMENVKKIFPITEKLRMTIKKLYSEQYNKWTFEKNKRAEEENKIRQQKEVELQQKQKEEEERKRQLEQLSSQQKSGKNFPQPSAPLAPPPTLHIEEDYPSAPKNIDIVNDQSALPDAPPPPYSPPSDYFYNQDDLAAADTRRPTSTDQFTSELRPSSTPTVDRTTKPNSVFDRQISSSISGLRRIHVPQAIVSRFLSLASMNTLRNVETCGILAGKLAKNVFQITHLVIPKQTGTPDSCTTTNEEEMFEVQDKYDLVTLGWIHTHPSQTSFLSSVDLHTHYAYQIMMPEAIAIVCAPKFDQVGVYRLTSNHGMSFIGSCNKTGFHPHPKEPPLFEESDHIEMDPAMDLSVLDLR